MFEKEDIKDLMREFNPWWKGKFRLDYKPREIYQEIKYLMSDPQIIALTGLRRTGKTTLMKKMVKDKIEDGVDPQNILYFSLDEFRDVKIRHILNVYREMLEKEFNEEETLVLLDEVHKLKDWSNQIKTIYDLYKGKMKIVISGSESLFIRKEIKETLAGRMYEFKVKQLSFGEYLKFIGRYDELKPLGLYERELKRSFKDYTQTMGFPEMVGKAEQRRIRIYVEENMVEKVIYRDLSTIFQTRATGILESILKILMREPGQMINIKDLSEDMGVSRTTLSNYLTYLEKSFLIKKLYNYSTNQRKTERKLRRFYPTVLSSSLLFKEGTHPQSQVFEWLLANQLETDFFWRDAYKNEVDFVMTSGNKVIPVEAKYGKIKTSGLEKFMDKFDVSEGWILTIDTEKMIEKDGKRIYVEPAYKFLLNGSYHKMI